MRPMKVQLGQFPERMRPSKVQPVLVGRLGLLSVAVEEAVVELLRYTEYVLPDFVIAMKVHWFTETALAISISAWRVPAESR